MSLRHASARHGRRFLFGVLSVVLAACGDSTAPVIFTTLNVTVPSTSISVGQSMTATATGLDQHGRPMAFGILTWSSSATGIATVTSAGVIYGVSAGTVEITGSSEGKQAKVTVTVTP
jgi:uncharacterized protein YjdB